MDEPLVDLFDLSINNKVGIDHSGGITYPLSNDHQALTL